MRVYAGTNSSSVEFLVYDDQKQKLYVRYRSGQKIYSVDGVDLRAYEDLCNARSLGVALAEFLRDRKAKQRDLSTHALTDDERERVLHCVKVFKPGATSALERDVALWQSGLADWF